MPGPEDLHPEMDAHSPACVCPTCEPMEVCSLQSVLDLPP